MKNTKGDEALREVHEMDDSKFETYLKNIRQAGSPVRQASSGIVLTKISEGRLIRIAETLIGCLDKSEVAIELVNCIQNEISRRERGQG